MVKEDKLSAALYAMHLIRVELRSMSSAGEDPASIAEVLDWVEAMPYLIAKADEDRTDAFRNHVRGIVEAAPRFQRPLNAFDKGCEFSD